MLQYLRQETKRISVIQQDTIILGQKKSLMKENSALLASLVNVNFDVIFIEGNFFTQKPNDVNPL